MTMEAAMREVESQLRTATNTPKGKMAIRKVHVSKVLHSQKAKKILGRKRADVVWCCVAMLLDSGAHENKDMHLSEENRAMLRAKGEAALGTGPQALSDKLEMTGSVYTWLTENEETNQQGVFVIRPGKLTQLKNARKDGARTKGGQNAIIAALVLLGAQGEATLMMDPSSARNKGTWENWIGDTVEWMLTNQWITMDQAPGILERATETKQTHARQSRPSMWTLNLGEGWRSVGRHIASIVPGAHIVGADRRGFTYTGTVMGHITAEVEHDWSTQDTDLITALSKKASVPASKWNLVTLEPECTLLSIANAINQKNGSAHGKWALTELNIRNSTPQRQMEEAAKYQQAKDGIRIQLISLEKHPLLPFLLENPADSELWELEIVVEILARQPTWKKWRIDRCAYGRLEQKPTIILTNIGGWKPKGSTGNGRCKGGKCTGTVTASGRTAHLKQTVANSKEKRVDNGKKTGGRYEWTTKAVVNALEEDLLREIIQAL